jgi:hypothetical protein
MTKIKRMTKWLFMSLLIHSSSAQVLFIVSAYFVAVVFKPKKSEHKVPSCSAVPNNNNDFNYISVDTQLINNGLF